MSIQVIAQAGYNHLVDQIYQAALEPDLWTTVMDGVGDAVGGGGVHLSRLNMQTGDGSALISRLDPHYVPIYFEHFALRNPLSNVDDAYAYMRGWRPKIITDEDWMPKEDLLRSEFYNDFMKPQAAHSTLMIRLAARDMDVHVLNINRNEAQGQFGRAAIEVAEQLHPHLLRAFDIGRRFAEARGFSQDLANGLDRLGHGVFIVGVGGRIRHANPAGERLLAEADGLSAVGGELTATRPDTARKLQALIGAALARNGGPRTGGSIPIPTLGRRLPLSLSIAPLRSERIAVFDPSPSAIVFVADVESTAAAPDEKLRVLFGLTPAEARVAQSLFDGHSPRETAEHLGLSFNTVRVHLTRIFDKTGVNRQAELIRLMMRAMGDFEAAD